jgi:outer membrane lipoprotein carrier protein
MNIRENILNPHFYFSTVLALLFASSGDLLAQFSARDQLVRFSTDMSTLSANFEQSVTGSDGEVQDQSEGKVWLSQPRYFRWEYGGEFPEVVVADGLQIWVYDEVLEQVTIKPQSDFAADSPLSLLTDISKLDEQFEVREAGDMDGMMLLELRSMNEESDFERVLIGLQNDELKLMTMEDAFGLRTEIRFSNVQRNLSLDPKLFSFTPPDGVDIIGSAEADTAH